MSFTPNPLDLPGTEETGRFANNGPHNQPAAVTQDKVNAAQRRADVEPTLYAAGVEDTDEADKSAKARAREVLSRDEVKPFTDEAKEQIKASERGREAEAAQVRAVTEDLGYETARATVREERDLPDIREDDELRRMAEANAAAQVEYDRAMEADEDRNHQMRAGDEDNQGGADNENGPADEPKGVTVNADETPDEKTEEDPEVTTGQEKAAAEGESNGTTDYDPTDHGVDEVIDYLGYKDGGPYTVSDDEFKRVREAEEASSKPRKTLLSSMDKAAEAKAEQESDTQGS